MSIHIPPSPPPSSDGDLQTSLGRFSLQTPPSSQRQKKTRSSYGHQSVYGYFSQSPDTRMHGLSSLHYADPVQPYGSSIQTPNGYSMADQNDRLTPIESPSAQEPNTPYAPTKKSRSKVTKGDKKALPDLPGPLSELTKHMDHIPLRNMEAHVNRSLETRLEEVEKKNGKIARPMNSFMLYRSAYAERTKEWCSKNNHQIVSSVSGQSWPLEPPEVRDKYEKLAVIDRENHKKAHPNYKFAPNKANIPPKRKRTPELESEFGDMEAGYEYAHQFSPSSVFLGHAQHKRHRSDMPPHGYPSTHPSPLIHSSVYNTPTSLVSWDSEINSPMIQEYRPATYGDQMSQGMPYLPGRAEAEAGFTFGRQPAQQYDFTGVFTSNGVPRAHREILEGTSTPQHQQQQAPRYPLPSMYAAFPSAAVDPQMLKYEQDDAMDNMLAANPVTTATTASMNHTSGNVMDPALFACTQPGETLSPTSAISAASPVDAVYSPAANTSLAQEWTDGSLGFPQDSFILA